MSSLVEQIKSKLSIADVVGSYLKLEKAGSNFKARCPFHNEKTASFFVSPSRETYHCFGCNRGGDIVSFVEEMEGLDFRGALKVLADRAGVKLTSTVESSEDKERQKIFDALRLAAAYYAAHLARHEKARAYLSERGVSEQTMKEFELGYAPNEWRALSQFLVQKGFSPETIERAGLTIKSEKARSAYRGSPDAQSAFRGYYDRFRGRIMFPIADSSGRIVGFSGRILPGEGEGDETSAAKYVNSPETAVFHKSKVLFGFDRAKQAIRKKNQAVLVEGQLDLVLSHQSGVTNAVAVSGTALTREHLILLKRLADVLIIAFDADAAGIAAGKKGVDMALREGFDVCVAELPEGEDPADVAKKDPKDWLHRVDNAKHIIDFYLKVLSGKGYDMREFRHKTSALVLPYIAQLKNTIDQAHFVEATARALHIGEEPIWNELKKISGLTREDEELSTGGHVEAATAPNPRKQQIERKIAGIIFWQEEAPKSFIETRAARERYVRALGNTPRILESISDEQKKDLIFEAEVYYQSADNLSEELELLLANLEEEALKEEFVHIMDELKDAETRGDSARSEEILKRCQEISKRLSEINKK